MRIAVLAAIVVILLSGCTSSDGLGRYMVRLSDLPADCDFLDPDTEESEFLVEELNWTGNPGRVDNEVFEEEGVAPVDNLVVWYRCDDADIISIALRYATPQDARTFLADEVDCPDDEDDDMFARQNIVAFIEGDGDDSYEPAVTQAIDRIQRSTGLMGACAYLAS